jgi:hypothetical protein
MKARLCLQARGSNALSRRRLIRRADDGSALPRKTDVNHVQKQDSITTSGNIIYR